MLSTQSPSPARKELAAELRALRGTTAQQKLAVELGWSQSKVAKIENGRTRPSVGDVRAWADFFGATTASVDRLVRLAAAVEAAPWASPATFGAGQRTYAQMEAEATRIRMFGAAAIPGLLQTRDYAATVLAAVHADWTTHQLNDAISARLARQDVLTTGKPIEAMITESALRTRIGPSEMHAEALDWLLSRITHRGVVLSVLALADQWPTTAANQFELFTFSDETVAVGETFGHEVRADDPTGVAVYERVWADFGAVALTGEAAVTFVQQLADEH